MSSLFIFIKHHEIVLAPINGNSWEGVEKFFNQTNMGYTRQILIFDILAKYWEKA